MEHLHLSRVLSLLVILTTTIAVAQIFDPFGRGVVVDQNGTVLQRPHECDEDDNCTQFSYCSHRVWAGSFCRTNLRPVNPPDALNCSGTDHSGKTFPVHKVCVDDEVRNTSGSFRSVTNETSTMRCFPQLNFTCAKSYFMPCTQNYDADGSAVAGQEEACPQNFSCTQQSYGPQKAFSVKLCTPDDPKRESGSYDCRTNFDCGYSQLEERWWTCEGETCGIYDE